MKQTLLVIPPEVNGIPVFGCGWLLGIWLLWGSGYFLWLLRKQGWNRDTASYLPMLGIGALAIFWLLPLLEGSAPEGLAIRGYGAMFLLAIVAGVTLTLRMARSAGVHPDVILSMSFWCFVFGIIGARLFFVIQYWSEFYNPLQSTKWTTVLAKILNFTEGGLVVYGSLVGAMLSYMVVMHRRRLPKLATLDLFVPGLAIGLAFGRIGCLLNGCCWGGVCEDSALCIHFPRGAPSYMEQLHNGELLGIALGDDPDNPNDSTKTVAAMSPNSLARKKGIVVGDQVTPLLRLSAHQLHTELPPEQVAITLVRDPQPEANWTIKELPPTSLGVIPTQIYSSINAALICLLAWAWYPARKRDGELLAGMLTLYPISRFLLEIIRNDEPGRWGTELTIAQWVSILMLTAAAILWTIILRGPARRMLPAKK